MRILFINTIDTRGGAARIAYTLKESCKSLGHSTSMFVKHKYSQDADVHLTQWPSLPSQIVKKITGRDLGSFISSKMHRLLATDIEWFNTDRILETEEFKTADVIHCHNLHGNYFRLETLRKIASAKPVIWTMHDMWPITAHCAHAYDGKITNEGFYQCPSVDTYQDLLWDNSKHLTRVKQNVYKETSFHIVTPCNWLREKIKLSVLKDQKIKVIYNGVDETIFCPGDKMKLRQELSIPSDKKIILFISASGTSEDKGGAFLHKVLARCHDRGDLYFVCIGENDPSLNGKNLMSVKFTANPRELAKYYAASDVFLFPSLAETFPLVVLEALSSGLPVVSFNVGGISEAVDHEQNGYLATYLNIEDLMRGIAYFTSADPDKYKTFSVNARSKVLDHFTQREMVNAYISLYEDQCGS